MFIAIRSPCWLCDLASTVLDFKGIRESLCSDRLHADAFASKFDPGFCEFGCSSLRGPRVGCATGPAQCLTSQEFAEVSALDELRADTPAFKFDPGVSEYCVHRYAVRVLAATWPAQCLTSKELVKVSAWIGCVRTRLPSNSIRAFRTLHVHRHLVLVLAVRPGQHCA